MRRFIYFMVIIVVISLFTIPASAITAQDLWFPGQQDSVWVYKNWSTTFTVKMIKGMAISYLSETPVLFSSLYSPEEESGPYAAFRYEPDKILGNGQSANDFTRETWEQAFEQSGSKIDDFTAPDEWVLLQGPVAIGNEWVIAFCQAKGIVGDKVVTATSTYKGKFTRKETINGIETFVMSVSCTLATSLGGFGSRIHTTWYLAPGIGPVKFIDGAGGSFTLVDHSIIPIESVIEGQSVASSGKFATTWGAIKKSIP